VFKTKPRDKGTGPLRWHFFCYKHSLAEMRAPAYPTARISWESITVWPQSATEVIRLLTVWAAEVRKVCNRPPSTCDRRYSFIFPCLYSIFFL